MSSTKEEADINVRYGVSILAFYLFHEDLTGLVKGLRNIDESIEPITNRVEDLFSPFSK